MDSTNMPHAVDVNVKVKLTPRGFFLWTGMIISLYASVGAVLTILFTSLNKAFPDALDLSYSYEPSGIGQLSAPISMLIVLFPIFTILTVYENRFLRKNPEYMGLSFRKFLIWLTLFLSSVLIATDLIVLVHYFLNGEITTRFVWKVVATLAIGAFVGGYYLYDLKRDVTAKNNTGMYFGIGGWVLVVFSVVIAFVIFGSPSNQRKITLDARRISSLQSIEQGVVEYWRDHGKMPATLDDVRTYDLLQDPEAASGKIFEYIPGEGTSYQVCATFSTASDATVEGTPYAYSGSDSFLPKGVPQKEAWTHQTGRTCFNRVIDVEQYPVYEKTIKN